MQNCYSFSAEFWGRCLNRTDLLDRLRDSGVRDLFLLFSGSAGPMLASGEKTWKQRTLSTESRASIKGLLTQLHRSLQWLREGQKARGTRHSREGKTECLDKGKKMISTAGLCWKTTHSIFLKSPIPPSQSVKDQAKFPFIIFEHRQKKYSSEQVRNSKSFSNLFSVLFPKFSSCSNLCCYISLTIISTPIGPAIKLVQLFLKNWSVSNLLWSPRVSWDSSSDQGKAAG